MKLTRTKAFIVIAIVAILSSVPALVSAQDIPHTILGTAYIDGSIAPQGTLVRAFIDGNEVESEYC